MNLSGANGYASFTAAIIAIFNIIDEFGVFVTSFHLSNPLDK